MHRGAPSFVTISIHALLAESDAGAGDGLGHICDFYPRSPCGERPFCHIRTHRCPAFLSTLSLRRATEVLHVLRCEDGISIHALLAESDSELPPAKIGKSNFYPRSPCGERHWHWLWHLAHTRHFYPRSPCGERRGCPASCSCLWHFYPRSPCGERQTCRWRQTPAGRFLSTLSLRRATGFCRWVPQRRHHFYPRSPCGERRARCILRF